MSEELKSCPFCGGNDIHVAVPNDIGDSYDIYCIDCGANVSASGREEVLTTWNTRASEREDWDEEAFIKFYIDREFPEKDGNIYIPHESVMWVKKFAKAITTKFKMPKDEK